MGEEDRRSGDLAAISCAFCTGDPERVASAFLGHYKSAFREGRIAQAFVELPIAYADVVLHLADAIADSTELARLPSTEATILAGSEDEGMWVEILPRAWVRLLASVPQQKLEQVLAAWARRVSDEGYETPPEVWAAPSLAVSLQKLIAMASEADSTGKPLLGLSAI